jgi:eukaryotic-like serine/threonine-protein kinase
MNFGPPRARARWYSACDGRERVTEGALRTLYHGEDVISDSDDAIQTALEIEEYRTTRFERVPPKSLTRTRDALDPSEASGVRDTFIEGDAALDTFAEQAELRVGKKLSDRYELRKLLGTGSAGAVYASIDHQSMRKVAVKVLHEGLRTSDEHVARFIREARAASAIGHPCVVTVYDVGKEDDGTLYMVMELLAGESLFYAIREKSLGVDDIVDVGVQLLDGLSAAHARGIIHRDVKPENVFLTQTLDGDRRVKLFDFGIAKCLRPDLAASFSTMDGFIIGTPHYMSPEICMGEAATPACDLWATAAVLYHALAGSPPFDDPHLGRLLLRIVRENPPSLGNRRADLSRPLVQAIDRALGRDPTKRWLTAKEFAHALRQ